MRHCLSMLAATAVATAATAAAKPEDTAQSDLEVRMGEAIAIAINDQPVRMRLAPDAISVPTLNADAAQRIGLKPSMIGYIYVVGPEKIGFRTDNVRYRAGTASFKRRTAFSDRQLTEGADGIAGPETFPFSRTKFIMREAQPGDRPITLPLDTEMGRSQTGVRIDVGGRPVYVAFSFDRAESLVTATGGKWIADVNRRGGSPVNIGDVSKSGGGDIAGHETHEQGRQVDIRPFRRDGGNAPVTWQSRAYDREQTRNYIEFMKDRNPGTTVLFNDPVLVKEGLTQKNEGHDNHLHFSFPNRK